MCFVVVETNLVDIDSIDFDEKRICLGPYGPFVSIGARESWMSDLRTRIADLSASLFGGRARLTARCAFGGSYSELESESVHPPETVVKRIEQLWREWGVALPVN